MSKVIVETKQKLEVIDKVLPRVDAFEKVTGAAMYINDIDMKGMLYRKSPKK